MVFTVVCSVANCVVVIAQTVVVVRDAMAVVVSAVDGLVTGVVPKKPAVPVAVPIIAPSSCGSENATPTDFVLVALLSPLWKIHPWVTNS